MTRERGALRLVLVALVAIGLACGGPQPSPSASPSGQRGGTLRVGVTGEPDAVAEFAFADAGVMTLGYLLRCCLARTPLTYPGEATADGGTVLQPDLAVALPDPSPDGMAWTLQLRAGVRYAPPYDGTEVTAADVIRAAERFVRLLPDDALAGTPLEFVAGAAAYAVGDATHISGLEAPDTHTVVVHLTKPYGGFGILADMLWSPIPAALADGHDDDMRLYWPSTGPYMYEVYPADPARPGPVALVRNPAWDPATDPRRAAAVDRIEIGFAGDLAGAFARLESGEFDFLDTSAHADIVNRYRSDSGLSVHLRTTPSETIAWLPMNLAVPPFDDPAVRRAANSVIGRGALRDLIIEARTLDRDRPQQPGVIAGHVFPDHLTANLLVGYDPFGARDGGTDLPRARVEMSQSRYDADRDGICDATVCANIAMPSADAAVAERIRADLAQIGIDVAPVEWSEPIDMAVPTARTAIQANTFLWGYNLTGSDLAALLQGGESLAANPDFVINASLVGARAEDLSAWGYQVTEVPSVDDVIARCDAEIGHLRARCWAELDQLVTESIVPWIPLFAFESAHVSSSRVAHFSLDQSLFTAFPALDKVRLVDGEP